MEGDIRWSDVRGKEARCSDGFDLGEVLAVEPEYVLAGKRVANRGTFRLPRDLIASFDGSNLWFGLTGGEAREFRIGASLQGARLQGTAAAVWRFGRVVGDRRVAPGSPCSFCVLIDGLLRAGAIKGSDYAIVRRHAIIAHGVNPSSLVRGIQP